MTTEPRTPLTAEELCAVDDIVTAWFGGLESDDAMRQIIALRSRATATPVREQRLHIHDYGDAEYTAIREGRADCVDPKCPDDAAHAPGEPHRYVARCTVCGQVGTVLVTLEPQRSPELSRLRATPAATDEAPRADADCRCTFMDHDQLPPHLVVAASERRYTHDEVIEALERAYYDPDSELEWVTLNGEIVLANVESDLRRALDYNDSENPEGGRG